MENIFLRQDSLKDASAPFSVEREGSKVYLLGDTYSIKNSLKNWGFHFDPDRKAWWVGVAKYRQVEDALNALMNAPTQEKEEEIAPGLKAVWKNRRVYLVGDTYKIKNRLQDKGFRWDPLMKGWVIGADSWDARFVAKLKHWMAGSTGDSSGSSELATPNQVAYAQKLLNRMDSRDWFDSDFGDGSPKPSLQDLRQMSKKDMTAFIESLRRAF